MAEKDQPTELYLISGGNGRPSALVVATINMLGEYDFSEKGDFHSSDLEIIFKDGAEN